MDKKERIEALKDAINWTVFQASDPEEIEEIQKAVEERLTWMKTL